jgi:O-acetyl-ADP-ribose deacetylase (regulator of RNase III)
MTDFRINLTAVDPQLADAWQRFCGDLRFVSVHRGSILGVDCDAVVSPANSFGFMDGGIDRLYAEFFGSVIQQRLQTCIQNCHNGELLVGQAEIVRTDRPDAPFVIAAPTMRVPMTLGRSVNPYLAARAIFLLVRFGKFSCGELAGNPIAEYVKSIALPGLGTGVGRMKPASSARQVRAAIEDFVLGKAGFPASTMQVRKRHDKLCE